MEYNEINTVTEYRNSLEKVNTVEFESVDLSIIVENTWKLFKLTVKAINNLGNHVVAQSKAHHDNPQTKMALDKFIAQISAIVGSMEKKIESIEGSMVLWVDLEKEQSANSISNATVRFTVHKILYNYDQVLMIYDTMIPKMIENLEKDKEILQYNGNGHRDMFS